MKSVLTPRFLSLALLLALAPGSPGQLSQTLPAGYDNVDGGSATNWPQNVAGPHRWQWHYDSGQFAAAGPILITEISVRNSNPGSTVQAFQFTDWTVTVGPTITDYTQGGAGFQPGHDPNFESNWTGAQAVVRAGPWSGGPIPPSGGGTAPWVPLGVSPYLYDPSIGEDFIIQIQKCGTVAVWLATMDAASGAAGANGGNRYGSTIECLALGETTRNNEFVPIVRIEYYETSSPLYQTNSPASSLDIGDVLATTFSPARVKACTNDLTTITFDSTNVGLPFDAAISFGPVLENGFGGFSTTGGQIVNVDLFSPALVWLLGGQIPDLTTPFTGSFGGLISTGATPALTSLQMFNLDLAHPDGLVLSQASELETEDALVIGGPSQDDSVTRITFADLPVCGPDSFDFFGTTFLEAQVTDNGRVIFGAPDLDFSPTVFEALVDAPFAGFWTDLDPPSSNAITIFSPAPDVLRINYGGVNYHGEAVSAAFCIDLDGNTGELILGALAGIPANPISGGFATGGDRQFLGLSGGNLIGATDAGPTLFSLGGSGSPTAATDMLYDYYDAISVGPVPALVSSLDGTALNQITFVPNGGGAYDWMGL